jgi:hypothetical protein
MPTTGWGQRNSRLAGVLIVAAMGLCLVAGFVAPLAIIVLLPEQVLVLAGGIGLIVWAGVIAMIAWATVGRDTGTR